MVRLSPEVIEQGATLSGTHARKKHESREHYLSRILHISVTNKSVNLIENLNFCQNLTVLYLYDNKIKRIQGLDDCPNLSRLYLQNNLIEKMEGFQSLTQLSVLHLAQNQISKIEGLLNLPNLQFLHLDNQRLISHTSDQEDEEGVLRQQQLEIEPGCFEHVESTLKVLTLNGNNLTSIHPIESTLSNLEELHLSNNNLYDWEDACHALGSLPSLRKLYLTGTPLNSALKFKQYITLACEGLEVLNNKEITVREREFLVKMHMANAKRKCQPNTSTSSISISSSITTRNTEQQAMFLSSATSPTSIEVLPHMPPYASQYRDLILQQTAVQQNRTNVLMKMSSVPRIELEFGSPTHTSKSSRQTTTTLARAAEK